MNNQQYKYIIIDAQNLFWRCFTIALKKYIFDNSQDIFPGAIQEFLNKYVQLKTQFGKCYDTTQVYLLFDNPESTINHRKMIDENYKSLRFKKSAPKGLYTTLKILTQILKDYDDNLFLISMESFEADDITPTLIKDLNVNDKDLALCVSADLDWARNIELSEYVEWYNFREIHTRELFQQKYKFYPDSNKIKMWKALYGDKSDSIKKALPYVKDEIILDLVNNCNKVKDIFVYIDHKKEEWGQKIIDKIKDARDHIVINYQLVDFLEIDHNLKEYTIECSRNSKGLKFWYDMLGIEHEYDMISKQDIEKNFLFKKKKIIKF